MRPRKVNADLPPCVYEKHGAFYFVRKNRWHYLGSDRVLASQRGVELAALFKDPAYEGDLRRHLRTLAAGLASKGKRGALRWKEVTITSEDVEALADQNGWCCAVTGLPFRLNKINNRRPYAPSVDRIDPAKGYHRDNCRIVCAAVNFAMNVWGEPMLRELAHAVVNKHGKRVLDTAGFS